MKTLLTIFLLFSLSAQGQSAYYDSEKNMKEITIDPDNNYGSNTLHLKVKDTICYWDIGNKVDTNYRIVNFGFEVLRGSDLAAYKADTAFIIAYMAALLKFQQLK